LILVFDLIIVLVLDLEELKDGNILEAI